MLDNLFFDNKTGKISWTANGHEISVHYPNIDSVMAHPKKNVIIALSGKGRFPSELIGFNYAGEKLFTQKPPDDFLFSYLTRHAQIDLAVVCIAVQKVQGWTDWHFQIDPDTGSLSKFCPAY